MTTDFDRLQEFLYKQSGLVIDERKAYLVESRLAPLMSKGGFKELSELMRAVQHDAVIKRDVIDAMMTNETFFFRDRIPFDNLRDAILPALMKARQEKRSLRIWCAAASTGQEPYSVAMTLDEEMRKLSGWNVEILATDLSSSALAIAKRGIYSQFEVQRGLPITHLLRYFRQESEGWQINDHLRAKIDFREFNLLSDFDTFRPFDIIFCRNVLIYFDLLTRRNILRRMSTVLARDGSLILGSAESVIGLSDDLVPHPSLRLVNIHKNALSLDDNTPPRFVA